jgi:hypothetical protein
MGFMILTLVFKTPDVVDNAIEQLKPLELYTEEELEEAREQAKKYITYGEYVVIELDTKTGIKRAL